MRIGIFSQWYEPEPGPAALPAVLGRALAERGHEVHVLTGFPNYPSGKLAPGYRLALRMKEDLGGVHVTDDTVIHSKETAYAPVGGLAVLFGNELLTVVYALLPRLLGRLAVWILCGISLLDLLTSLLTGEGGKPPASD